MLGFAGSLRSAWCARPRVAPAERHGPDERDERRPLGAPRETAPCPAAGLLSEAFAKATILRDADQRRGQGCGITWGHQQAGHAIKHGHRHPPDGGCHRRGAAGGCLEDDHAEAFGVVVRGKHDGGGETSTGPAGFRRARTREAHRITSPIA